MGVSIEVAEDESWSWWLGFFFVEDGVEESVGFESVFGDGGSSSVAVGVVSSWVDMVFKVQVSHVKPSGGGFDLFVGVSARCDVERLGARCGES